MWFVQLPMLGEIILKMLCEIILKMLYEIILKLLLLYIRINLTAASNAEIDILIISKVQRTVRHPRQADSDQVSYILDHRYHEDVYSVNTASPDM